MRGGVVFREAIGWMTIFGALALLFLGYLWDPIFGAIFWFLDLLDKL